MVKFTLASANYVGNADEGHWLILGRL